jgi:hypothetical protein
VLIALKAANLRFLEQVRGEHSSLVPLVELRDRSIEIALAYEKLLRALKDRNWGTAFAIAVKKPTAAALLRLPIGVRFSRILGVASKDVAKTATPERSSDQAFDKDLCETDREARIS